jgi:hypothetical protein
MSSPIDSASCPSCERFIGPADVCPYCEADSARPPILRRLRLASLLLATIGLVCLYLMSQVKEVPDLHVGEVTPMMNFATARFAGTVARPPYVRKQGNRTDYVALSLDDGTGEIRVMLSGTAAAALVERGRLPARGDEIEVTGTLNVWGDGASRLKVQSADLVRMPTGLNVAKESP